MLDSALQDQTGWLGTAILPLPDDQRKEGNLAAKDVLVPVEIDGVRVFVEARRNSDVPAPEGPVGAPDEKSIDKAIAGIGVAIGRTFTQLNDLKWSKLTVEVGVEFLVETGGLVAVIGKVGSGSSLNVSVEFERSDK